MKYFVDRSIDVVVVYVRDAVEDMLGSEFGSRSDRKLIPNVLISRSELPLDDVLVLKEAFKYNCPIVSNDKHRDWMQDSRIDRELRSTQRDSGTCETKTPSRS